LIEITHQSNELCSIDGSTIVSVENLEQVHERLGACVGRKRAQNEQEFLEIENAIAVLVERRKDQPHEFDLERRQETQVYACGLACRVGTVNRDTSFERQSAETIHTLTTHTMISKNQCSD
jgi:hypothetical protein